MSKKGSKKSRGSRESLPSVGSGNSSKGKHNYKNYPLHMAVWHNEVSELRKLLIALHEKYSGLVRSNSAVSSDGKREGAKSDLEAELEKVDPRGRTALLLAVCLDHYECAKLLLEYGASASVRLKNASGDAEDVDPSSDSGFTPWSAVHEATCTGDVQLLSLILQHRDAERQKILGNLDTKLLQQLRDVPDFYVEMRWEFTSWIPFVARLCPSDTCRIFKKGANVRLDTTLVGFENTSWVRGQRSFMFIEKNGEMSLHEVDHDAKIVRTERSQPKDLNPEGELPDSTIPSEQVLAQRMRTPVMLTNLDTQKVQFERARSGLLWRSDKTEVVSGHSCKVYSANNVTFVTKSRSEHLTDDDKKKLREEAANHPLNGVITAAREETPPPVTENGEPKERPSSTESSSSSTKTSASDQSSASGAVTYSEYFDSSMELGSRDIGRPKKLAKRSKTFKCNLWLCDDYPLSLREQVLPIIDMMASTHANFAKLHDFISLHLPSGFPVKIEIPLFHVLTAKITFDNIFACNDPVENVQFLSGENGVEDACDIDDKVFEIPADYEISAEEGWWQNELLEDDLDADLQVHTADNIAGDFRFDPEVLEALKEDSLLPGDAVTKRGNKTDRDVAVALRLSSEEMALRSKLEEEELLALQEAMRRSLEEK